MTDPKSEGAATCQRCGHAILSMFARFCGPCEVAWKSEGAARPSSPATEPTRRRYWPTKWLRASDAEVGPACSNVRVPPTIDMSESFREAYVQGYRHALSDARDALAASPVPERPTPDNEARPWLMHFARWLSFEPELRQVPRERLTSLVDQFMAFVALTADPPVPLSGERETPKVCVHGHTKYTVGCVSCCILFGGSDR